MNRKAIAVEIFCFVLSCNFLYEGLYYLMHHGSYSFWLENAPYLKGLHRIISYAIPLGEMAISGLLFFSSYRTLSLYLITVAMLLFNIYLILNLLFNPLLFFPFHAFWGHSIWFQKMLFSLSLAWLSVFTLILTGRKSSERESNILRKKTC